MRIAGLQGLRKDHLISEERADVAMTEAQVTQAGCKATRESLMVAEARIAVVQGVLERSILRAPFAGVVAEVNAELGEFVTPSPQGIATLPTIDLIDASCLYVSAPIDEVDAPAVRLGMDACVSLDAFVGKRCSGKVRRIAPYVLEREKQARTVEVEVEINDTDDLKGLLPGYSADIEITLERRERALRVPTEAVLEGNQVLVYRPQDGILEQRRFEPGLSNWDFTEVKSGLPIGTQIVLSVGREGVAAGVRAEPEDSTRLADP